MTELIRISRFVLLTAILCGSLVAGAVAREYPHTTGKKKGAGGPDRVLVIDGTSVHNVGELQMHLLNWGEWGSRPGTGEPYSFAPSAQYPAGSAIEYLYSAGLWVGAIKHGLPAVSTASLEREFRPSRDPRDIVYRSSEGAEGGNRAPSVFADDDEDGRVDEDRLDGYDNDLDGLVDEDYASISRLMMTCRYSDMEPVSKQIYPEHNPLNILVYQESYQWDTDRFDDFIGIEFHITNMGDDILEDVFVGMFVDADAGPRDRSNYWEDDMAARRKLGTVCSDMGPVDTDIAYMFDADGDDGLTTALFGAMFLGYPTNRFGLSAPTSVGIASYTNYSGRQTFLLGGDPSNDFERYEVLSEGRNQRDSDSPRDYRFLISAGPFRVLLPESTLVVQMAFVAGDGQEKLFANAVNARLALMGAWFDQDRDPLTGIQGRETPNRGPTANIFVDPCRQTTQTAPGCDLERSNARFNDPVDFVPPGRVLWSNNDCNTECLYKSACGYLENDSLKFRTGVAGRETHVPWVVATAPPPPHMRIDDHASDGVGVYWDNYSEVIPDNKTLLFDFEGYRVWRADDWTRPLGTSVTTGPPTDLWRTRQQVDVINDLGDDTGLFGSRYDPLNNILPAQRKRDLIEAMKEELRDFPGESPACAPDLTREVCDTLEALARWELGIDGGRQYYRFIDRSVHLGAPYFYAVVAFDNEGGFTEGNAGDPASNFEYVEPKSAAQPLHAYDDNKVYVVPNPVTAESMSAWALSPNNSDPSGVKLEFRNLPRSPGTIRIYTLAGDLVKELRFDGTFGNGTVSWDLISRNGQDIVSGVYLYSVEYKDTRLARVVNKFTVVR